MKESSKRVRSGLGPFARTKFYQVVDGCLRTIRCLARYVQEEIFWQLDCAFQAQCASFSKGRRSGQVRVHRTSQIDMMYLCFFLCGHFMCAAEQVGWHKNVGGSIRFHEKTVCEGRDQLDMAYDADSAYRFVNASQALKLFIQDHLYLCPHVGLRHWKQFVVVSLTLRSSRYDHM